MQNIYRLQHDCSNLKSRNINTIQSTKLKQSAITAAKKRIFTNPFLSMPFVRVSLKIFIISFFIFSPLAIGENRVDTTWEKRHFSPKLFLAQNTNKEDNKFWTELKKKKSYKTIDGKVVTNWGQLSYEIHFPQSHHVFAQKVKNILDLKAKNVLDYFQSAPKKIHFIIEPASDANGAATVFPVNTIWLNDFPPLADGQLYRNREWITPLVLHELTHVVHMDMTNGLLGGLRWVFGATAKLGGIIPRWFAEGLAVWIESSMTEHGRLKDAGIKADLLQFLSDPRKCQTIDCLDEPGSYPFGNFPYWVGAFFMDYLESLKEGTLKCLVFRNSRSIPFFLNSVFKKCTGLDAETHFFNFRKNFIAEYQQKMATAIDSKLFNASTEIKMPLKESLNWYLGNGAKGQYFLFPVVNEKTEYLVSYDWQNKKMKKFRFDQPISSIATDNRFKSVATIKTKRYFGQKNSNIYFFNPDKNKISKEYKLEKNQADYVHFFPFDAQKNIFIATKYELSRWSFYRVQLKENHKKFNDKVMKDELFFQLPPLMNFHDPVWLTIKQKHYLGFLSEVGGSGHQAEAIQYHYFLWKLPDNLNELQTNGLKQTQLHSIFSGPKPVNYIGQCQGQLILHEEKSVLDQTFDLNSQDLKDSARAVYILPLMNESLPLVNGFQLKGSEIDKIDAITIADQASLIRLANSNLDPRLLDESCEKVLNGLKSVSKVTKYSVPKKSGEEGSPRKLVSLQQTIDINNTALEETWKKEAKELNDITSWEGYPSAHHFLPSYWMFSYLNSANIDFFSAYTSISDPRKVHELYLQGHYYFDLDKTKPTVLYQLNLNPWSYGLSHIEYYTQSTFSSREDFNRGQRVFIQRAIPLGVFEGQWMLSGKDFTVSDFLSSRDYRQASLDLTFAYLPTFFDDFWQTSSLNINSFHQWTENKTNPLLQDFFGHQAKVKMQHRFHRNFKLHSQASYGQLSKNDLRSGVLFGGGGSNEVLGADIYHEFYGIPFTDVFGNKISTGRLQAELLLNEHYRGSGLVPFFMKDFSLLAGTDYISADRIFIADQFFINESMQSVYGGVRLDVTLFYLAKLEIDLLLAQVIDSKISDKESSLLIQLRGRLF